jgi:hypothetical protein
MSKIKLGDWLEIEFLENAEKEVNNLKTKLKTLRTTVANIQGLAPATVTSVASNIDATESELDKVKSVLQAMKRYPR